MTKFYNCTGYQNNSIMSKNNQFPDSKMKKVLLYLNKEIFEPTNYKLLPYDFDLYGGNTGNLLFFQASRQYLLNAGIDFDYYCQDMTINEINENYRCIILPTANLLSTNKKVRQRMRNYTELFSRSKIPVFILGIGAQAPDYNSLPDLYQTIKNDASAFIKTVYETGGQFSLRGYFTEELFKKLGFQQAVVTGCPSLYQHGRDLQVTTDKVKLSDFKPLINGTVEYLSTPKIRQFFKDYPQSQYLDQDQFLDILYKEFPLELSRKTMAKLLKKYSAAGLKLVTEKRLNLFADLPVWKKYIKDNQFNFAFGQRIHGNIISVLSNVPAVVHQHDSRTRELAEFFEIPTVSSTDGKSLYEIYENADYSRFNRNFAAKYDNFAGFLNRHGIISDMTPKKADNTNGLSEPQIINSEFISYLKEKFPNQNQLSKFFRFKRMTYKIFAHILPSNLGKKYMQKYIRLKNLLEI